MLWGGVGGENTEAADPRSRRSRVARDCGDTILNMPRCDKRTHVFDYGGTAPTETRERSALDEFCKRLRSCDRAPFEVIPLQDAIQQSIVLRVHGATVDGVLRTPSGLVAVELLGYSPLDDRGDVMARDLDFRKKVMESLGGLLKDKCYSHNLWYNQKRRTGPKGGMVHTVPLTKDFPAVVEELRAALTAAPALGVCQLPSDRFDPSQEIAAQFCRQGAFYLDAARFPECSRFFQRVRLQGLHSDWTPEVDSNLKIGFVGLDSEWVKDHLRTKAEKSLDKSKQRAPGRPLWLIVHSDGHAIHQIIAEDDRPVATQLCRDALSTTQHGFERAYWADRTGFLDAAWVGRVL